MPYKPTGRPPGRPRHPEPLTPAEQRVLMHIRDGRQNAEIASRLGVSPDAVKYHVSNMLGKLELDNREQLAAWREPSGLRRVWAAAPWVGWKLAAAAASVAVVAVGVLVAWGLTRDGTEDAVAFGPEDLLVGVVSVGIDGQLANGASSSPSISGDGRLVAFESEATNLVKGDTNGFTDIFVFDRLTRETKRVSLAPGGQQANGHSHRPAISADGKWVAFDSEASNLVKDDVNGELARALPLLAESSREQLDPPTSEGAQNVNAAVGTWGGSDVFVLELASGRLEIVSVLSDGSRADLGSFSPAISQDGRYVAFQSTAPNLAGRALAFPGAENPWFGNALANDVYFRDRQSATTQRISRAADPSMDERRFGSAFPAITPDGGHVAFASRDGTLVGNDRHGTTYYVWSRAGNSLRQIPWPGTPAGADFPLMGLGESRPAISEDGTVVVFGYSGSAAVRPLQMGIPVDGLFFHREGASAPTMIPGTEGMGDFARSGLAADHAQGSFIIPVLDVDDVQQVSFRPGETVLTPILALAGPTAFIAPAVSNDGRWIAATSFEPSLAGKPSPKIVVVPR